MLIFAVDTLLFGNYLPKNAYIYSLIRTCTQYKTIYRLSSYMTQFGKLLHNLNDLTVKEYLQESYFLKKCG